MQSLESRNKRLYYQNFLWRISGDRVYCKYCEALLWNTDREVAMYCLRRGKVKKLGGREREIRDIGVGGFDCLT